MHTYTFSGAHKRHVFNGTRGNSGEFRYTLIHAQLTTGSKAAGVVPPSSCRRQTTPPEKKNGPKLDYPYPMQSKYFTIQGTFVTVLDPSCRPPTISPLLPPTNFLTLSNNLLF